MVMRLKAGIPLAGDVQAMVKDAEVGRHLEFHNRFGERHREALKGYYWSRNPLRLWSRRWEYPFAAERVLRFAESAGEGAIRMLDAGSGVTYFPYFLCERISQLQVTCVDTNSSYAKVFEGI